MLPVGLATSTSACAITGPTMALFATVSARLKLVPSLPHDRYEWFGSFHVVVLYGISGLPT